MRTLRPAIALAAAVAALAGCDTILGTTDRSPEARVSQLFMEEQQIGPQWVGFDFPFQVFALDQFFVPVPGARIVFTATRDDAVVFADTVTTDDEGWAGSVIRPTSPGIHVYTARVLGRQVELSLALNVHGTPTISFQPAEVTLPGVGSEAALFARVLDAEGNVVPGAQVTFSASPVGIVSFHAAPSPPEGEAGMRIRVRGEAPGETTVTATHVTGAMGTARVNVGS
jgi:hypothetical protein